MGFFNSFISLSSWFSCWRISGNLLNITDDFQKSLNGITGEPCNIAAGESCDTSFGEGYLSAFVCYGPPNDVEYCGSCNQGDGPWCVGTSTCNDGCCWRYCCGDEDCGTGHCRFMISGEEVFPGTNLKLGVCGP